MAVHWPSLRRNMVFRALVLSLMVHLLAFGTYKWGQTHGWWRPHSMPAWMRFIQKHIPKPAVKALAIKPKPKPVQPAPEVPMTFVDVDPSLASQTPPAEKKYYGAANTLAASQAIKDSELPLITGTQEKVLKTTDPSPRKPEPVAPAPTPKIEPKPEPKPPAKTEPQQPEPKSEPKTDLKPEPKPQPDPQKTQKPGDLAFAKPSDAERTGKSDQPQVKPAPSSRPRTVEEAMKKRGIPSEKMRHQGGSVRLSMESSLDVTRTASGDYDAEFVDAVQQCWNRLLEERNAITSGKVVVTFKLLYDGRITDMKIAFTNVGEMQALICRKAIEDPAPYRRWPMEMRREIKSDAREMKFTFYYLNP